MDVLGLENSSSSELASGHLSTVQVRKWLGEKKKKKKSDAQLQVATLASYTLLAS